MLPFSEGAQHLVAVSIFKAISVKKSALRILLWLYRRCGFSYLEMENSSQVTHLLHACSNNRLLYKGLFIFLKNWKCLSLITEGLTRLPNHTMCIWHENPRNSLILDKDTILNNSLLFYIRELINIFCSLPRVLTQIRCAEYRASQSWIPSSSFTQEVSEYHITMSH